jgi:alkylated DNA repair dioxygenase AlkB
VPNANREADLFGADHLPEGFSYAASLLDEAEEQALLAEIRSLPFRDFEFHGEFLLPVREQAAAFAKIPPQDLQQVLATEYGAGAAIGWHRDRSVFGDVVGISLLSSCTFRLRRKQGGRWQRANLTVEPRSVYLLRGPSRTEWEHSIPAVSTLRYSITFRNVLDRG